MSNYPRKYKTRDGREAEVWYELEGILYGIVKDGAPIMVEWGALTGISFTPEDIDIDLIFPPELAVGQVWNTMEGGKCTINWVGKYKVCVNEQEMAWHHDEFYQYHTFLSAPEPEYEHPDYPVGTLVRWDGESGYTYHCIVVPTSELCDAARAVCEAASGMAIKTISVEGDDQDDIGDIGWMGEDDVIVDTPSPHIIDVPLFFECAPPASKEDFLKEAAGYYDEYIAPRDTSADCGEHKCHPMTNPDPTPTCPHCGDGMVKADSWTCYCGWGSR